MGRDIKSVDEAIGVLLDAHYKEMNKGGKNMLTDFGYGVVFALFIFAVIGIASVAFLGVFDTHAAVRMKPGIYHKAKGQVIYDFTVTTRNISVGK